VMRAVTVTVAGPADVSTDDEPNTKAISQP
jgi:hypothetical protein